MVKLRLFILNSFIILGFFQFKADAQDIHFSQFDKHIIGMNAAQTGYMSGDFRVNSNHRMQWLAIGPPFLSNTIAFDHIKYWHKERFGWGFIFLNDRSGNTPLLVNQVRLSLAYHKDLGPHSFSFGAQPGWSFKSYDSNFGTFPDQYDRSQGGFNNALPSGDAIALLSTNYFDLNYGIIYRHKGDRTDLELGYSSFHVNKPIESFFGNMRLATRHSVQATLRMRKEEDYKLDLVFMHNQQNKAQESVLGLYHRFVTSGAAADEFFVGSLYRHGIVRNSDALILVMGVKIKHFTLAYSYDLTVSEYRKSNDFRGASEVAIIYEHPSSILKRKAIPCERY